MIIIGWINPSQENVPWMSQAFSLFLKYVGCRICTPCVPQASFFLDICHISKGTGAVKSTCSAFSLKRLKEVLVRTDWLLSQYPCHNQGILKSSNTRIAALCVIEKTIIRGKAPASPQFLRLVRSTHNLFSPCLLEWNTATFCFVMIKKFSLKKKKIPAPPYKNNQVI